MIDYFANIPQKRKPERNSPTEQSGNKNIDVSISVDPRVELMKAAMKTWADVTTTAIQCFTDYLECCQHEKTERKRIMACLEAIKYRIDAQKEAYIAELNNNYAEKQYLYDLANKVIGKALEDGNLDLVRSTYNFILDIYNNGPKLDMPAFLREKTTIHNYLNSNNEYDE